VLGHALEHALGQETVGAGLAVLAATLLAGCARLHRLATLPGGIEVADLDVSDSVHGVDAKRLRSSRAGAAPTCTSRAPARSRASRRRRSIDLLSSIDGHGISGTVAGLVRAAWPTNAYRMQATLVQRAGPQPCGVSVQELMLPSSAMLPDTCGADTWGGGDRAGDELRRLLHHPALAHRRERAMGPVARLGAAPEPARRLRARRQPRARASLRRGAGLLLPRAQAEPEVPLHPAAARLHPGEARYALGALATYEAMCKLEERGAHAAVEIVRLAEYRRAVLHGVARLAAHASAAPADDSQAPSQAWERLITELATTVEHAAPAAGRQRRARVIQASRKLSPTAGWEKSQPCPRPSWTSPT
jgi:hypothetical protein